VQKGAVCEACHDATGDSGTTIVSMHDQLAGLAMAVNTADASLARAERAGMLVDDGRAAFRQAHEQQVQARVLVHTFAKKTFDPAATAGLAAANQARDAGDAAMRELGVRRTGLGVATVLILGFLVLLGLKIRRLPPPPA
jgi:hypothetical protein